MAVVTRRMEATPEQIFAVLLDPTCYPEWVVGAKDVRAVEDDWPAVGSSFHHTVGVGPFEVSDYTEALEARPPELLRMRAKGRPLGTATVTMELIARDGGTLVRMTERPDGPAGLLDLHPFFWLSSKLRNAESLMRLEELAARRA